MSGAVAFVFGLCALSFAAGCVLTAFMLRREPEPEEAPGPSPAPPRVELKLDVRRPSSEDYATKPIHRNPVLGLPVVERPVEPPRPALTLVPEPQAEPVRLLEAVPDLPAEPAARPAVELVAEPIAVDLPTLATDRAQAAPPDDRARAGSPDDRVRAEPARAFAESQAAPAPVGPEEPARVQVALPDADEFRRRYLRTFEAVRKRTTT